MKLFFCIIKTAASRRSDCNAVYESPRADQTKSTFCSGGKLTALKKCCKNSKKTRKPKRKLKKKLKSNKNSLITISPRINQHKIGSFSLYLEQPPSHDPTIHPSHSHSHTMCTSGKFNIKRAATTTSTKPATTSTTFSGKRRQTPAYIHIATTTMTQCRLPAALEQRKRKSEAIEEGKTHKIIMKMLEK